MAPLSDGPSAWAVVQALGTGLIGLGMAVLGFLERRARRRERALVRRQRLAELRLGEVETQVAEASKAWNDGTAGR